MKLKFTLLALLFLANTAKSQNYSILFDGSTQYVNCGNGAAALTGSGAFTIEAWIKTTSLATQVIIQQREPGPTGYLGEYVMRVEAGKIHWFTFNGSFGVDMTSVASVNDGNWHHVAATIEGDASGRIYIDGLLDLTQAGTSISLNALTVAIGVDFRDGVDYFNGNIEEIRIWNVARTQAELKLKMFKSPSPNSVGLVALYQFNENGGTTLVNSCTNTSGIDGTIVNGPSWTASPIQYGNNAVDFDGTDDIITTPLSLNGLTAFTLEGWVFPAATGNRIAFFGQNDVIEFGFIDATTIGGYTSAGGVLVSWPFTNITFPLNTWHHVAFTADGTDMKLYVDGVLQATAANPQANYGSSADLFNIGAAVWDAAGNNFTGAIDEVRVWNVARTLTEIQNNRFTELNPASQSGMIGYYSFNEAIPSGNNAGVVKVLDLFGNNTALLNNFALNGATSNFVDNSGISSLPIRWLSFTGQEKYGTVYLEWKTAEEINVANYIVQHSADGNTWQKLGTVLPGDATAATHSYRFNDKNPVNGNNYYRILQQDLDGRYSYSAVVRIKYTTPVKPQLYPNPVTNGIITVKTPSAGLLQLFTSDGRLVFSRFVSAGTSPLSLKSLPKGIYTYRLNNYSSSLMIQ